jgi:hypothetical protein
MNFLRLLLIISSALVLISCSTVSSLVQSEKEHEVIFYNTYGYSDGDHWIIPMKIYVHHRRESMERFTARLAGWRFDLDDEEKQIFTSRANYILADSEWRETVKFSFKNDPHQAVYQIVDPEGNFPKTDLNGIKKGEIKIPKSRADSLLYLQSSVNGSLTIEAISKFHTGTGKIQLIEPEGLSVISDIDDTVKITELPAGSRVVTVNTFFKEFTAAPGMAELYNEWDHAAFHYVSGAPWQLYEPLSSFLSDDEQGYPEGSFHMKNLRKNYFNLNSWRDLAQLITNENPTFDQKTGQITTLLETFPERQFILIGDSGEKDPEIYSAIRDQYPEQIKKIIIRDVVNARELNPERLSGMEIIPAKTIHSGVSQFH